MYAGNVNTTESFRTCMRWDAETPHKPRADIVDPNNHPDGDIHHNHCRTLYNVEPWCYTTDTDERWEFCNIQECSKYIVFRVAHPL